MISKKSQLKLQELMEQHEELGHIIDEINADQSLVISKILHEIRNPLTLINSSLQYIETQHPEIKDFRFWLTTLEDLEFLKLLLNELSTYNNGEHVTLTETNIEKIISPLESSLEVYNIGTHKKLTVICPPSTPTIIADEIKLRQAVTNLLKNAIESTDDEGSVTLRISFDDKKMTIDIIDTGVGITPEQMEHLFTPFVTYKKNGTGLGLSISKKIIESHNGTLQVTSKPGSGTTFTIIIPLKS